jgi:hypothetical protein
MNFNKKMSRLLEKNNIQQETTYIHLFIDIKRERERDCCENDCTLARSAHTSNYTSYFIMPEISIYVPLFLNKFFI